MSYDVMWCHAMSCHVMWCNGMTWDVMWGDVMGCGCVMCWIGRWCAVNYGEPRSQQNPWDVRSNARCSLGMQDTRRLGRAHVTELRPGTTKTYYVLQCSAPVRLRTTQYFSSSTRYNKLLLRYYSLLLRYYSVLQSTTKYSYYKVLQSTTLYYKVRLRTIMLQSITPCYTVLQSITPYYAVLQHTSILLRTTK